MANPIKQVIWYSLRGLGKADTEASQIATLDPERCFTILGELSKNKFS